MYFRAGVTADLEVSSVNVQRVSIEPSSTVVVEGGIPVDYPGLNYQTDNLGPNEVGFSFVALNGEGTLFNIPPDGAETMTISATIDVTYSTAFKRELQTASLSISKSFVLLNQ